MILYQSIGLHYYHLLLVVDVWVGGQGGFSGQKRAGLACPTPYCTDTVLLLRTLFNDPASLYGFHPYMYIHILTYTHLGGSRHNVLCKIPLPGRPESLNEINPFRADAVINKSFCVCVCVL